MRRAVASIGSLNASGASAPVPLKVPNQASLACLIGAIQGVAISGAKLELSRAVLAQLGR